MKTERYLEYSQQVSKFDLKSQALDFKAFIVKQIEFSINIKIRAQQPEGIMLLYPFEHKAEDYYIGDGYLFHCRRKVNANFRNPFEE